MNPLLRLLCLAVLFVPIGSCGPDSGSGGSSSPTTPPPPPPTTGDGMEGPTLTYPGGHPLNWLTDDAATLQFEDEVLALVNAHRATIPVGALVHDTTMRRCARGHSRHMTQTIHDFFAHTNPEGDSPFARMTQNGITYTTAGENIAAGYPTAAAVMTGWLNSPGHRANIENASFGRIGIGYAPGTTATYFTYWTQVFAN